MKWTMFRRSLTTFALFTAATLVGCEKIPSSTGEGAATPPPTVPQLKIASYEPTVELYKDLNAAFPAYYSSHGGPANVPAPETSHGPSGTQSKKIIEGNEVDIAALSVDFDIDKIAEKGLLPADWRTKFPNDSVPYTSSVLFLVRKGNPKAIKDWEDLASDDVTGVAPDPKSGGGARWIYLSTWAHSLRKSKTAGLAPEAADAEAKRFTGQVYDKAVLDPAMRQSTTRFVGQGEGDVLFGWENEILQITNDSKVSGDYELVVPSDSITIEVPIAVVDQVAKKRGTTQAANDYVKFIYSDEGQAIIAKRYNRPSVEAVAAKYASQFKPLNRYRFKEHFTSWPDVMKRHFGQGGELDQMRGAGK